VPEIAAVDVIKVALHAFVRCAKPRLLPSLSHSKQGKGVFAELWRRFPGMSGAGV